MKSLPVSNQETELA